MRRRTILAAPLALAAGVPATVSAAERAIGWISPESYETTLPFFEAFKAGLQPNPREPIRILERYATTGDAALAAAAAELQQLGVRLIVTQGAATLPVLRSKPKVPVVFGFSGDPVAAGIAESLPRPGRNATGVSFMSVELLPKRIDFLRMAVPGCQRVALLSNARHPGEENEIEACRRALAPAGISLSVHRAQGAADLKPALAGSFHEGVQALVVLSSSLMVRNAAMLAAACLEQKLPMISGWGSMARAGALLTYGPNLVTAYRRVASYVERILAGADPGGLPIEQPTHLELVINARTAATIGLTLPPSLLTRADEIVE